MPGFFCLAEGVCRGLRPTVVSAGASVVVSRRFVTSLSGDRQAQAVVGREQRTAPADGQCVEDAQFAQRTSVVPGVGEEFRCPAASAVPPLALTTRALPSAARATYSLLESRAAGSYRSSKENRVLFRAVDGCRTVGSSFRVTHEPGRGEADRAGAGEFRPKVLIFAMRIPFGKSAQREEPVSAGA